MEGLVNYLTYYNVAIVNKTQHIHNLIHQESEMT